MSAFVHAQDLQGKSLYAFVYVCLDICVYPCVLVSATENQRVALYNLRPRGSVKCGHGPQLGECQFVGMKPLLEQNPAARKPVS